MKKLIWFSLIGLLFTIGCKKDDGVPRRQHEIICFDPSNHAIVTHHILTTGNVFAFIIKDSLQIDHPVLAYSNEDTNVHHPGIIYLEINDCEVY